MDTNIPPLRSIVTPRPSRTFVEMDFKGVELKNEEFLCLSIEKEKGDRPMLDPVPHTTITREFQFDYGHRVLGHESKCKHLHGHRARVLVTVTAARLDSVGRVIDFGKLKALVGAYLDETFDHNMILHEQDPLIDIWKRQGEADRLSTDWVVEDLFGGKAPIALRGANPTAENLAAIIFRSANRLLEPHGIAVTHVRFYETPSCFADYSETTDASPKVKLVIDD